jgi:hypothetical protein
MVADLEERPLYSSLTGDPTAEEAIDAFVLGLAERIDALQDAESGGPLESLIAPVAALQADAGANGFDYLAQRAEALEASCREGDAPGARKHLIDLTAIAKRIRLGHRGAF